MSSSDTIGFGCPNEVDPHHFVVEIPAGRNADVLVTEQYGIKAGIDGNPEISERCLIPRTAWGLIAEDLKREFNQRLKERKLPISRWTVGENKVERLLGKELLILAWAVEEAPEETIPNAVRNWIGLKPEERWWLFAMTAAATGGIGDANIGWRKALRYALTENPLKETESPSVRKAPMAKSKLKAKSTREQMSLLPQNWEDPELLKAGRETLK